MAFIVSAIQGLGCPTVILDKGIRTDYDVDGDPDAPMVAGNQIKFEADSSERRHDGSIGYICNLRS